MKKLSYAILILVVSLQSVPSKALFLFGGLPAVVIEAGLGLALTGAGGIYYSDSRGGSQVGWYNAFVGATVLGGALILDQSQPETAFQYQAVSIDQARKANFTVEEMNDYNQSIDEINAISNQVVSEAVEMQKEGKDDSVIIETAKLNWLNYSSALLPNAASGLKKIQELVTQTIVVPVDNT